MSFANKQWLSQVKARKADWASSDRNTSESTAK